MDYGQEQRDGEHVVETTPVPIVAPAEEPLSVPERERETVEV